MLETDEPNPWNVFDVMLAGSQLAKRGPPERNTFSQIVGFGGGMKTSCPQGFSTTNLSS
jgi:hypothetical protein